MKVLFVLLWAAAVLGAASTETTSKVAKEPMPAVDADTDMAMIDVAMKTSTERPPTKMVNSAAVADNAKATPEEALPLAVPDTQRHTVADFIIHPIIALKARSPVDDDQLLFADGRQADGSTTAAPPTWQVLGVSAGQGISSLASWVADRFQSSLQLPSLESTIASSTTPAPSTTKTPDIVVRVQHKPTTRRPLIAVNNANRPYRFGGGGGGGGGGFGNGLDYDSEEDDYEDHLPHVNTYNKRRRYPAAINNNFEDEEDEEDDLEPESEEEYDNNHKGSASDEEEEEEEEVPAPKPKKKKKKQTTTSVQQQQRRRKPQKQQDDADDDDEGVDEENASGNNSGADDDDEEEEEQTSQRPNNRRRPLRNNRRGGHNNFRQSTSSSSSSSSSNRRSQSGNNRRQPQDVASVESIEDDEHNNNFYYGDSRPSTKRSQSSSGLRGPQNLFNQIRQFTRMPSPGEIGSIMRKTPSSLSSSSPSASAKRRQQATLFVNSNGQTVYVAPELVEAGVPVPVGQSSSVSTQYGFYPPVVMKKRNTHRYPQPPLTTAMKLKGQGTQYITIPWNQLGISPPNQLTSIATDLQSEPHILNIPQNSMDAMITPNRPGTKKRPAITADAVPLLADASLMDIFQPPQIPPSRASPAAGSKPGAILPNPSIVTAKARPGSSTTTLKATPVVLPNRIRAGTIVEKAPAIDSSSDIGDDDTSSGTDDNDSNNDGSQQTERRSSSDKDFILVGDDNEAGLTRQAVQPVFGEARYFQVGGGDFDNRDVNPAYFIHRGRLAVRKGHGRSLPEPQNVPAIEEIMPETGLDVIKESASPILVPNDESKRQISMPIEHEVIPVQIIDEDLKTKINVDVPQVPTDKEVLVDVTAPKTIETVASETAVKTDSDDTTKKVASS